MEESQVLLTWRYFKSFGYMHVDDQISTKLDDKSKKMIFIGNDKKIKMIQALQPKWRKDGD